MAVGRVANLPFLWDPHTRELSPAEFVAAQNLRCTRQELFGLVRAILATYDLALVPIGPKGYQVYRVTPVRDLAGSATAQPTVVELGPDDLDRYRLAHGLYIRALLRVEHPVDLASVRSALMAHATADGVGRVEILPDLPGFAVTEFAPAVAVMHDALRQIDVPATHAPARVTERIDLEHAQAEVTAVQLADHLGANVPLPGREDLTPVLREAPTLGLRILADERTNALLVSGSPERVAAVLEAVALLDLPEARASTWIHVVRLKHLDAIETAQVLRELMAGRTRTGTRDDAPPPTIVADVQGNTLVVEATPKVYEELLAVVRQLDVRVRRKRPTAIAESPASRIARGV